jgi:3-hydroxyisobutyrate dehydrogenase-like beta-hydroxyacid dehydrogenase
MATIAFIGLGNMGNPMAANLVKAGHDVRGFDLVAANLDAVDAPVSGGVGGAQAGEPDLHGGGTKEAFEKAEPVLAKMGRKVVHCGEAGAGQAAKICNNMILGISMIGVSRGLRAGGEARAVASGAVRRRLDLVGPVLVADELLPRPRPGAREPRQQRLQAGLSPRA